MKGVDVNGLNVDGESPLFNAVKLGKSSVSVVFQLIEKGANIHIRNYYGNSILHKALDWGTWTDIETVKFLVEKGNLW